MQCSLLLWLPELSSLQVSSGLPWWYGGLYSLGQGCCLGSPRTVLHASQRSPSLGTVFQRFSLTADHLSMDGAAERLQEDRVIQDPGPTQP
jgi:hypothetical protein